MRRALRCQVFFPRFLGSMLNCVGVYISQISLHTDFKDFKDVGFAYYAYRLSTAFCHSGRGRAQDPRLQSFGGYALIDERRAGAGLVPVRIPNGPQVATVTA